MRGIWAMGVVSVGLLLVGTVYGCLWYAIPDRPLARDWPIYGPLLLGPYALTALGCGLSRSRFVRILAAFTVLVGLLIATVAVFDVWPMFTGGLPPAMPESAIASGVLLLSQYAFGVLAAVYGVARRST